MHSVSVLVSLPIHKHFMVPWNDMRRGDCCGRFESITDGYYCKNCDFFVHKICGDGASEHIQHPSHSLHALHLFPTKPPGQHCDLCGRDIVDLCYRCGICDFDVCLCCAKNPPPEVIDISETHHHKLTLVKERDKMKPTSFKCSAECERVYTAFRYGCDECDLAFHVECVWYQSEVIHPSEVNHSYHSLHPLKLFTGHPPDYSDGKCRLCGTRVDKWFYHCSSCNFTLDLRCVLTLPPQTLLNLKAHDHQLTLLPRLISFTCNTCGLKGDRSPYICVQCDFVIHQDCLGLPTIININRHDHRVSRTCLLGVVNSVCGICRQKVDWTCGGYSCKRCSGYVVHSKCATSKDVWNGKELQGVPEETEDIEPYVVIDDSTIQHFSHTEHYLRLNVNDDGILYEEKKRCIACSHPIGLQSFYGCRSCDFILHRNCANLPRKKWHVLHNDRLTLVTDEADWFVCRACARLCHGFRYKDEVKVLDVRCGSISEPFVHPSHHPNHPLFHIPDNRSMECNGCKERRSIAVLSCIEDGCGFALCFKCATLPQVVKHRVHDHPLTLCYGDDASGKYWCEICETETDPSKWFYTCKDHHASLHTRCVLGDFAWLMPRSTIESFEVLINDSVSRPFCTGCKSRCLYPIILKLVGYSDYLCSGDCVPSDSD
uniref:Zinc finger PHD-type domain-containing protein n=1 Tax=Noccaea caerulescens TaxID=107243 RepID=A0A1J3F8U2_NOCCA